MRWDVLFADLEAQAAAADRSGFDAEVADRTRAERARLTLADRVVAQRGRVLGWHLVDGTHLTGRVEEAGADWALVREAGPASWLVPTEAVAGIAGLTSAAAAPHDADGRPRLRLPITVVLRAMARDRAGVLVHLVDGAALSGTIDHVGQDHVDLALHPADEVRRPVQASDVRVVPLRAVVRLRLL
jgi:hypothetical protein